MPNYHMSPTCFSVAELITDGGCDIELNLAVIMRVRCF